MIRRIATVAIVVAASAGAVLFTGASEETAKGKTYLIAFDNAFGLTEGGDLRVGGVKAGKTKSFSLSTGPECQGETPGDGPARACAIVNANVTEPGFTSFRSDAHCAVRQQSLIGEYYVDCQPGKAKEELPSGSTIPSTRTASTIPADLVNNVLRRPYRDRLRLIIAELGTGLAGRPQDLAELLRKAHPGLRETTRVLKILGSQRRIIKDFIADSNVVVRELDRKKRDVARWITVAGRTAEISATRRAAIAAGIERFPRFLDELRFTMARLEDFTDAQTPLLRNLQVAAPDLEEFFTRLGPFSEASRPAVRSLGEMSVVGEEAFRNSREEIKRLRQVARDAPGTGKPLRQFLQTLDDRSRAANPDPRAVATAPPSPDPTSRNPGRGFTGFESLWNYFFWQTLAINEFDSVSHVLRVLGIEDDQCNPYRADLRPGALDGEADEIRERCNEYLGPYQPGVTHPDPTRDGAAAASTPAERRGERRGRGEPRAEPLPGQYDPSVPNPTLPPSAQEMLESVGGTGGGTAGTSPPSGMDPATAQQALDYLLGP